MKTARHLAVFVLAASTAVRAAAPEIRALSATIQDVPARPVSLSRLFPEVPAPVARPLVFGNPGGAMLLLALDDLSVRASLSADNGTTFVPGPPVLGPDADRPAFFYTAKQAPSGRIYVAAITGDPAGGRAVETTYTDDTGATWAPPGSVPAIAGKDPGFNYLAFDATSDGRLALAWITDTFQFGVYACGSVDAGMTWTSPTAIVPADAFSSPFLPAVAIDPGTGRIHAAVSVWSWTATGTWITLSKTESDDGGATWSALRRYRFSGDDFADYYNVDLAVASDGSVLLATYLTIYDDFVRVLRSTDGGITFSVAAQDYVYGNTASRLYQSIPRLTVVSSSATVVLTYWGSACTGSCNDPLGTAMILRSGDNGATWGPHAGAGVRIGWADKWWPRPPAMRLADGSWVVVWHDTAGSDAQAVWITRSTDDAVTWSPAVRLSAEPVSPRSAQMPAAAPTSDGHVFVAWEDTEDMTYRNPSVHGTRVTPGDLSFEPEREIAAGAGQAAASFLTSTLDIASDGVAGVYALHKNDMYDLWVEASADRGRTFGSPVRLMGFPERLGPAVLAAAPDGNVYVAAVKMTAPLPGTFDFPVMLFHSGDFGRTWTTSVAYAGRNLATARLRIVAGDNGHVLIAWSQGNSISIATSSDAGATFNESPFAGGVETGTLALCQGGGRITMAWSGPGSVEYSYTAKAATSADWGTTFTPIKDMREGLEPNDYIGVKPAVACSAAGTSIVTFADTWTSSGVNPVHARRFDGTSWAPVVTLPTFSRYGNARPRATFTDAAGTTALIAYEDDMPKAGIHMLRSIDGGVTFGSYRSVDAGLPRPDADSYNVSLVSDGAGNAWLSWLDNTFGAQPSVLVARTQDGGATWGDVRRLDRAEPRGAFLNTSDTGTTDFTAAAALPGAGLFAWYGQNGSAVTERLLSADDLTDQDRDGIPADIDCNDNDPTIDDKPCRNHPPVAVAGPSQVLECTGIRSATARLDGSASYDLDSSPGTQDDIASYAWTEGTTPLASGAVAEVPFALGSHDVTLTVTDRAGATGTDGTTIAVRDTRPPSGAITFPSSGACFGPTAVPVTVTDSFADVCDPAITRSYAPGPGPSVSTHGDHTVTLTATDSSGNAASATVPFTIDLVPPTVAIASPPGGVVNGSTLPFGIVFGAADDDGAAGGVLHEWITLQGCVIYDGATYGNRDGLLSDESLVVDDAELCRIFTACGFTRIDEPVLTVFASDCGGNVGLATRAWPGSLAPRPGTCGAARPSRRAAGRGGQTLSGPAPRGAAPSIAGKR